MKKRENGILKLISSKDKFKVFAEICPPEGGGTPVGLKQIKEALIDANIVFGVIDDLEIKRKLRAAENKRVSFVIAAGNPPAAGADATLDRLWLTSGRRQADLNAPSIDLRELDSMRGVRANEIIARKIPPTEGAEGISVSGKFIRSRPGSDRTFMAGANVTALKDGWEFMARICGMPRLDGNVLSVSPVMEVNGNVDYSVGNIDFAGTVIIRGDVTDGFTVNAEKDVIVTGHVDAATISAGGDIVVKSGITNRCMGFVAAGGGVTASYIINSIVEAEKDIIVEREIMHSFVRSNGSLRCAAGRIIGGDFMARDEILSRQIGSPVEAATVLRVGFNFKTYIIIKELEQKLSQTGALVRELHMKLNRQSGLSQEQAGALKEEMQTLEEQRRCIEAEIHNLRDISPVNEAARIRCPGTMYGLVSCWIGGHGKKIVTPLMDATVGIDPDGEITTCLVQDGNEERVNTVKPISESENPEAAALEEPEISVLIADNSRYSRKALKDILENNGFKVAAEAENSGETISLCQKHTPGVIVMDLLLPGADFSAAVRAIRSFDPDVKIVITAGTARLDAIRKAIDSGALGFVLKPFDVKQTIRTIRRAAAYNCAESTLANAINE